jgi:hypothetical protein
VRSALEEKDYRLLTRYEINERGSEGTDRTVAFTLYARGTAVIIVQEWLRGGCDLYGSVSSIEAIS